MSLASPYRTKNAYPMRRKYPRYREDAHVYERKALGSGIDRKIISDN